VPKTVEVSLTLLKCEALYSGKYQPYLEYLENIGARIETWHSGEPERPLEVPPEQLFVTGGFTVSLKRAEITVSLLRKSGVLLAEAESSATPSAAQKGSLRFLTEHADPAFGLMQSPYGFADISGDEPEDLRKSIAERSVDWLFWLNYFGREYLDEHGVDYFRKAPFLRVDEIDGGVKCSTRELPWKSIDSKRQTALVEYFGGSDKCHVYRASEHLLLP